MINLKKLTLLAAMGAMCLAAAACGKEDKGNDAVITPDNSGTNNVVNNETTSAVNEGGYKNDVSVKDIEAAVAEALGENYFPNVEVETLEGLGITEDMYDEFIYKQPMISANVDTLIVVRAKEDKVAEVEAKLNAFRDMNINDLMQYPMNLTKIQCSRVTSMGNYVMFVQFGGGLGMDATDAAIAASDRELTEDELVQIEMEVIDEQNDIALEVIRNMIVG
ncbi:MAG: DUF4358 domain-containing protein [Alistipes sp.]|nr:DUF4358 domain-containing protein [Alistipes sp.]